MNGLSRYNVVILGAGLAGLTLARQLLLSSDKRILLLEKRPQIPPPHQKVGESNVQVQGFYLSKVLDLEEHLFREHLMKYNLRFYWKTPGLENDAYEELSQTYIRNFSNIACYQLDRNRIEAELLRLNMENPRFRFTPAVTSLDVTLSKSSAPHRVRYLLEGQLMEVEADWVVDTTGRSRFLARRESLTRPNAIRHGSVYFWTEGMFNIEKLTGLPHEQRIRHRNRRMLGHLPVWLATNHFCGDGYWFWVIPLQGKTSFGLVYDHGKVPENAVVSAESVIAWVSREFPLLARSLPQEKILDRGMHRDFSYDCRQTLSAERWALAGEAGRFTDPLYSPGGDLIALYNTLICDAILTESANTLAVKVHLYEVLMWAWYEAYIPSYAITYELLGDQECFAMKYAWELTIYFTFYVFPFVNGLLTHTAFVVPYLDLFARIGAWNHSLQAFLRDYCRWKKTRPAESRSPVFFDLTAFEPLQKAEELFYETGVSAAHAIHTLKEHLSNVERLGRLIAIYIYSVVLEDESLLSNRSLVETLRLDNLNFDPESMRHQCNCLDKAVDRNFARSAMKFASQFRSHHAAKSVDNAELSSSAL